MPMVTGALMTFTVKKNHAVVPRNPLSEKREARPGIAVLASPVSAPRMSLPLLSCFARESEESRDEAH